MAATRLLRRTVLGGMTALALAFAAPAAQADHIKTGSDLRVAVNLLLAEHVNLAAAATGWAMMGMNKNFEAAAGALDANSVDLANAIGLVYGDGAKDAFLPLWRKHINFFVDYTTATVRQSAGGRKKAVDDLMQYAEDFGAFLNSANPNLPADAVAGLVREHVSTLAAVVDAQANQNWTEAYELQRKAAGHMQMISDALADAIVKQFPEKFGS
jgi:hypothetical protein